MKQKLATLEVWLEESTEPSQSEFNSVANHGTITIRVPGDPAVPIRTNGEVADALAHELGHFLGNALRTPAHQAEDSVSFARVFGINVPEIYATETEAWDYAEKMRAINPAKREQALATYRE